MRKVTVCFIDDQQNEARGIGFLLERSGKLKVMVRRPTPDVGAAVPSDLSDLFMVDYVLDTRQDNDTYVNYKGGTLIAAIQEKAPGYPVTLITRTSFLDARQKKELESELRIDAVFYKSEVYEKHDWVVSQIIELATGFKALRQIPREQRDWRSLLSAIGASSQEADLLRKASPPLYKERGAPEWGISQVASWIRNTLLGYPGILYDPVFAATELRISVNSFLLPEVQELFADARYTGVFAPSEGRWWRERLWHIAMDYVEDTQFADAFAETFYSRTGAELELSRSIVRGETPADTVCYVLRQPVMYKYTVAYRPDNRPPVMDPARVSFKALQLGDQVQWALIEGVDDETIQRIREMEL